MKLNVTITKELDDSWGVTPDDSDETIVTAIKDDLISFVDSAEISVEREMSSEEALTFMRTKMPGLVNGTDTCTQQVNSDDLKTIDELIY